MADLDTHNDHLVVFEAIRVSDTSRLNVRQPLQPKNNQVLTPTPKQKHFQETGNIKDIVPNHQAQMLNSQDENRGVAPGPNPRVHMQSHQAASPKSLYNISSPAQPSDALSPAARSSPKSMGSRFQSPVPSHMSTSSRHAAHLGNMTPSSTFNQGSESTDPTASFVRYLEAWRDRIRVSFPRYTEGKWTFLCSLALHMHPLTIDLHHS